MDYFKQSSISLPETLKHDLVWGRKGIAHFIGCTVDRFDTMVKAGAPIRKRAGGWVATKSDLMQWLNGSD